MNSMFDKYVMFFGIVAVISVIGFVVGYIGGEAAATTGAEEKEKEATERGWRKANQIEREAEVACNSRLKQAAQILKEAEKKQVGIDTEIARKRKKMAGWVKHIEGVEKHCADLNDAMKDVVKHATRIMAEVNLAEKKDERPPSFSNIRKSCKRIFRIKAGISKTKEALKVKPEEF